MLNKINIISTLLGLLFVYLSVAILSYGAAIAIPLEISDLAQDYPLLILVVLDIVAMGLPLLLALFVFAAVLNLFNGAKQRLPYALLLLPFLLLHTYYLGFSVVNSDPSAFIATTLPKYALLIIFTWWFANWQTTKNK
ncbi:hypothetical protein [Thalassotalea sp. ND16A]|uniref:hypothetical protein n=1 Tax=Thalassotalea sp. ND16A TaxID=1535422 RepID=UPI00051A8B2B|nr:hypothetical protein [Thalassotalea sp. ND16A]KGJ99301.1 hypothetical protein ND16A_3822 [Thalassotalea sp. ND16A]